MFAARWYLSILVQRLAKGVQCTCQISISARGKGTGSGICKKQPHVPSKPWYSAVPIRNHTLQQMVKKVCSDAGIGGYKTNHSLRATGATELFKRGAPEKLIQERTGHRSLEALRTCERSSEEQHKAASTLLSAPSH